MNDYTTHILTVPRKMVGCVKATIRRMINHYGYVTLRDIKNQFDILTNNKSDDLWIMCDIRNMSVCDNYADVDAIVTILMERADEERIRHIENVVGRARGREAVLDATSDMVNHPPHYQSSNGLEVIDFIEAFTADLCGLDAVCTANALKYLCRWNHKNGLEDLKKAKWYLEKLISRKENNDGEKDNS